MYFDRKSQLSQLCKIIGSQEEPGPMSRVVWNVFTNHTSYSGDRHSYLFDYFMAFVFLTRSNNFPGREDRCTFAQSQCQVTKKWTTLHFGRNGKEVFYLGPLQKHTTGNPIDLLIVESMGFNKKYTKHSSVTHSVCTTPYFVWNSNEKDKKGV